MTTTPADAGKGGTPRTENELRIGEHGEEFVDADFARFLERDLQSCRDALAQAEARGAAYRKALSDAAYALFQLNRFADAGGETKEHAFKAHQAACRILDDDAAIDGAGGRE